MQKNKSRSYEARIWSENEVLNLVYLVGKHGKRYSRINHKYKEYFSNRTNRMLSAKYKDLEKNKAKLDDIKRKAQSLCKLNETPISVTQKPISNRIEDDVADKIKLNVDWTHEECLYLVYGVKHHGQDWSRILELYGEHFQDIRTGDHLKRKYLRIENDQPKHKFLLKEIDKLLESK